MHTSLQQLAADPEVRAALAAVPRNLSPARPPKAKSFFPAATEAELEQGLRRSPNPEDSLHGLIARILLLESQVARLMKQSQIARRKS